MPGPRMGCSTTDGRYGAVQTGRYVRTNISEQSGASVVKTFNVCGTRSRWNTELAYQNTRRHIPQDDTNKFLWLSQTSPRGHWDYRRLASTPAGKPLRLQHDVSCRGYQLTLVLFVLTVTHYCWILLQSNLSETFVLNGVCHSSTLAKGKIW